MVKFCFNFNFINFRSNLAQNEVNFAQNCHNFQTNNSIRNNSGRINAIISKQIIRYQIINVIGQPVGPQTQQMFFVR